MYNTKFPYKNKPDKFIHPFVPGYHITGQVFMDLQTSL